MSNDPRAVAQFWARLASIPSLENLREGERMLLVEDFKNLVVLPWLDPIIQHDINWLPAGALVEGLDSPLHHALILLHKDVRRIIIDLLDGKTVPAPSEAMAPLEWKLEGRALHEQVARPRPEPWHLFVPLLIGVCMEELVKLLRQRPFPFKRCLICPTVFVPVRKQMYCLPYCTIRAAEMARKDTKRDYMRDYMAKRRRQTKVGKDRKEG